MKAWQSYDKVTVIDRETLLKIRFRILIAIAFSVKRKSSQQHNQLTSPFNGIAIGEPVRYVLPIAFTSAKMIDPKHFLQTGCLQWHRPVGKLTVTTAKQRTVLQVKLLTVVLLPTAALLIAVAPLSAKAQCTASYAPGSQSQRISSGLFDGRVGPVKVVNNTENATVISLYHPDAPKQVFKYWYAEPGKSYLLGTDNYSSDWGIQVDEGPICIVGRVASWDGATFTTFPSRLFIAEPPPRTSATTRNRSAVVLLPSLQPPATYEAIALKQLTQGEVRGGLISLLRAADLYRANGQSKEEKRVRDRIKQIRGS